MFTAFLSSLLLIYKTANSQFTCQPICTALQLHCEVRLRIQWTANCLFNQPICTALWGLPNQCTALWGLTNQCTAIHYFSLYCSEMNCSATVNVWSSTGQLFFYITATFSPKALPPATISKAVSSTASQIWLNFLPVCRITLSVQKAFHCIANYKTQKLFSWRSGKICQLPRHWQWKGSLPVQAQLCLHKLCAMCLCNAEWYMQCNAQCSVCSVQCSLKGGGSLPDTKRQFASPVQTVWYSLCSVGTVQCSV